MENQDLYDLRNLFLKTWPLERVKNMTIEEYTNLNKENSFCYWIEKRTEKLGSILGGGVSFKFGIYKRKNTENEFENNAMSDGEYAWLIKYGKTRDEAFAKIKSILLEIIEKSLKGDFQAIESVDLGNATKWKIAHLYSNNQILNVFSKEKLIKAAKKLGIDFDKKISFYDLQNLVLNKKSPNEDFFTFAKMLFKLIDDDVKYWTYRPGEQANRWEEFYKEGIMAIGWDKLGDLKNYSNRTAIKEALMSKYGGQENQSNNISAIDDFCNGDNKMNIGDIIIAKKGTNTLLGYGEVTSDYYFDDDREEYKHCRKVNWLKRGNGKAKAIYQKKYLQIKLMNKNVKKC